MMAAFVDILSNAVLLPGALLFLFTVTKFLPVAKLWRKLLLAGAGAIVFNPIIWLGDAVNILLVAVVLFIAIPVLCGGQKLARFSVSLLLFNVVISAAAVFSSLRPPLDEYMAFLAAGLWLCLYLFVRRYIAPEEVQTIRTRLWLLLDGIALLPFSVTVVIVLFTEETEQAGTDSLLIGNERVLLILLALAALFSIALLLAVALLVRIEKLERQQLLWTIRQQQYEKEEQNRLQVRRLRHDIANHLNAMAGMNDETMRAYLLELVASPAMTAGQRFCENEIVNAVLSGKQAALEHSGIEAEIMVSLPVQLSISDIDLCAIFSNCIDNAVEACIKCEAESRWVKIHARAGKGIFALQLENSMAGALQEQDGRLHTTKQDKANHGLGMAEIQDIVQQHGGVLKYGQEENTFKLKLSIPLQ